MLLMRDGDEAPDQLGRLRYANVKSLLELLADLENFAMTELPPSGDDERSQVRFTQIVDPAILPSPCDIGVRKGMAVGGDQFGTGLGRTGNREAWRLQVFQHAENYDAVKRSRGKFLLIEVYFENVFGPLHLIGRRIRTALRQQSLELHAPAPDVEYRALRSNELSR